MGAPNKLPPEGLDPSALDFVPAPPNMDPPALAGSSFFAPNKSPPEFSYFLNIPPSAFGASAGFPKKPAASFFSSALGAVKFEPNMLALVVPVFPDPKRLPPVAFDDSAGFA